MSQYWLSNWLSLSSSYVFKTVQPNLSRAHQPPLSASTNWMHTHFMQGQLSSHQKIIHASRSQYFTSTWSLTLHLYVNFNSLPLREIPIKFSRTQIHQIASFGLHYQMVVPLRLPTYLTQGIKLTVVHLKWTPSSSSTCDWIFNSESNWLSHMNLFTTVMENNDLH